MPINEKMADRIRESIARAGKIEEKKMVSGMCFMVNDKMCICVNEEEILCRIGPDEYEAALEKPGCRPMQRNGKAFKDYVFVRQEEVRTKKSLDYWVQACLGFNEQAQSSKTGKKKAAAPVKKAASPRVKKTAAGAAPGIKK